MAASGVSKFPKGGQGESAQVCSSSCQTPRAAPVTAELGEGWFNLGDTRQGRKEGGGSEAGDGGHVVTRCSQVSGRECRENVLSFR